MSLVSLPQFEQYEHIAESHFKANELTYLMAILATKLLIANLSVYCLLAWKKSKTFTTFWQDCDSVTC